MYDAPETNGANPDAIIRIRQKEKPPESRGLKEFLLC